MTYREYAPPVPLRGLVECLWLIRDPRTRRARPTEHIIPDACPEIIVHLDDRFSRWMDGRWRRQPVVFLAGTLTRPWKLLPGVRVRTLGIRFRPAGVTRFFDIEMQTATDREVPLGTLAGADRAGDLISALHGCQTDARLIAAARRWLVTCARVGPRRDDLASRAAGVVLADRGRMRVAALARHLEVSRRRLERSFARHIGIRPKLFTRIVRLQAVLATLGAAERGPAVEWALEAGYFDQAHLARDFRAIAGRRASRPRERDGELARHFSDPERVLALLRGE